MRPSGPRRAARCISRRRSGSASGKMASAAGLRSASGLAGRSLVLLGLAALVSAALLLWAAGSWVFAAAFLAGILAAGGVLALRRPAAAAPVAAAPVPPDAALLRAALDMAPSAH